jgi:hypothetical protein
MSDMSAKELAVRIVSRPTCPQPTPQLQADDDQDASSFEYEHESPDQESGYVEEGNLAAVEAFFVPKPTRQTRWVAVSLL